MKNNKGITLVTLVITIVVMAILAGVTVATTNLIEESVRQKKEAISFQTKKPRNAWLFSQGTRCTIRACFPPIHSNHFPT